MNQLEAILDDCLRRMTAEGYSVRQCLEQHPQHRAELAPLLESAQRMQRAGGLSASPSYKSTTKAMIMARAEAQQPKPRRERLPAWRLGVAAVAVAFLLLASTTAFAQAAVPGEALYEWKLTSEEVWRAVSPDRVGVDLTLAGRRAAELTRVASDPLGQPRARQAYHEALTRLEAEINPANGPKIDQALRAHQKKLTEAGMRDDKLDDLVRGKGKKNK